ncbi:MAG: hypothetical protein CMC18_07880 [Flavobacteriaceae bacterium]|nr:hypothetical protein [Flavobacteriaceae bacterium]
MELRKYGLFFLLISFIILGCTNQIKEAKDEILTPYELGNQNQTTTYEECIAFYKELASGSSKLNIQNIGITDSGWPLHLVTFNPESEFNFKKLSATKSIVLINNGIHPGEPEGIDASMMLMRDLVYSKIKLPKNTVLTLIPIYNIGGSLNRNTSSRVNQNGPEAYGFRGNALNYDLNRDFIKNDTENAKSFQQLFHLVNPDFFIDTHVSNGADYQYTLTHLYTQEDKLGKPLGALQNQFKKDISTLLKDQGIESTPYVNVFNRNPKEGFSQFYDSSRYSTGYTALFHTPGLMIETHMLKPYAQRVSQTYSFLKTILDYVDQNSKNLKSTRLKHANYWKTKTYYPLTHRIDSSKSKQFLFKGYASEFQESKLAEYQRLKYLQDRPENTVINYYNRFAVEDSVRIPQAFVIKSKYAKIINHLKRNQVILETIEKDTVFEVQVEYIQDYKTSRNPYEGHYYHYQTQTRSKAEEIIFQKGDVIVYTRQNSLRYVMESLEARAPNSFFNWNYFDAILQRKEGFSPYVFEDLAFDLLQEDLILKAKVDSVKRLNPNFKGYPLLNFIFRNSKYLEKDFMRYPIYKIP